MKVLLVTMFFLYSCAASGYFEKGKLSEFTLNYIGTVSPDDSLESGSIKAIQNFQKYERMPIETGNPVFLVFNSKVFLLPVGCIPNFRYQKIVSVKYQRPGSIEENKSEDDKRKSGYEDEKRKLDDKKQKKEYDAEARRLMKEEEERRLLYEAEKQKLASESVQDTCILDENGIGFKLKYKYDSILLIQGKEKQVFQGQRIPFIEKTFTKSVEIYY